MIQFCADSKLLFGKNDPVIKYACMQIGVHNSCALNREQLCNDTQTYMTKREQMCLLAQSRSIRGLVKYAN